MRKMHTAAGLSPAEAASRLQREGPNELPRATRRSVFRLIVDVLREPMLLLLLAGGLVYLALGDRAEAMILLAFACLSVGITVVQEARTEGVLEALRDLTSPRALVIRGGDRLRIAGREVVRGDLIVLAEGDRVPADARLVETAHLLADESLLTGEAVPVRKKLHAKAAAQRPGGEDLDQVFSGSLIVGGAAIAEVTATGLHSEIGKIGKSLSLLETETPHLQKQMQTLVLWFALIGGAVSLGVVGLYGLTHNNWLAAILAGIAVGMSMLPEEFPMVLAVFMAMGAWRISAVRVLTRRASAIETLGAASVLCTDKTGTLTENRMTIAALQLASGEAAASLAPLSPGFAALAEAGTLASAPKPFDPMEKAFHSLAPLPQGLVLKHSYPLTPDLLAMSQVWQRDGQLIAFAKGAPEAVARLCGLPETALQTQVDAMAAEGLRVLAVAEAAVVGALPAAQIDLAFRLLGLVGLADPLRAAVPQAVATCKAAGIRVIMITGDHPSTAQAIARAAGLGQSEVITGDQLALLDDAALQKALRRTNVFARIMPEQKLRLVQALKSAGAIVAMTGDGVNDAPSLKAAHIGVAMGGRGTDVAREAASIVLLDDDFGSIVTTIALGRRIYDNLRKAMSFILAVHVPIAGLALLPLILGTPVLFGPVHIAFLEMIIDPVCALVFEAEREEDGLMARPPRPVAEPLFSAPTIVWSVVQGLVAFGVVASVYLLAPGYGLDIAQTRTLTFTALVISIVALILVNRVRTASVFVALSRRNRALGYVLAAVCAMLAVVVLLPQAQVLFGFALPPGYWPGLPFAAGAATLLMLEAIKPIWAWVMRRRRAKAVQA
ncbi:MAG: Ca2+-transporting ATPase [Rhodobacteraceae bacterium]|uniref:cation-translocating P-type ATPase n=1 Tax=Cypionkella sp. TaxID=2811411 RepID=UPI0013268366|nr:cation-translocating P-type ATPase [Cypionkella sp.]KAF0172197.1 MAG: Ca2+-transporting ATPase [Paracoccaceae bacterium]MDO8327691.1 cation-translocating P-type ATPase [Cypionkella sp.]